MFVLLHLDSVLNFSKSSMFFSPNVRAPACREVTEIFDFIVVPAYARYLGLPTMMGWKKKEFYHELQHHVIKKLEWVVYTMFLKREQRGVT